ncbi:aminotransferase class I/II-fold pyridoxal phosphate-dependent enzyme [Saccharopolyspora sp. NPDC050642]|uniref:aminotransferase class I/II-fold pyridoxal phosphate-dependent enzyme n=1 Tax=Saccharopolyspora sp. NPDC050642 TaxID=3157099 RepID=UPI0033DDD252
MEIDLGAVSDERQRVEKRTAELFDLIENFDAVLRTVGSDEVARFELLCEQMFSSFVCPDESVVFPGAAPLSNLDTGDAMPGVYPPFAAALRDEVGLVDTDGHHYYGPEATAELVEAARRFLARTGFLGGEPLSGLEVLPSAGTVHGYDALCKVLVRNQADTVIVPELGYGFFLTQPHRVGGRVVDVPCDGRGRVTASSLRQVIEEQNRLLWQDWVQDRELLFGRAARKLAAAGIVAHEGENTRRLAEISDAMAADPDAWRSAEVGRQLLDLTTGQGEYALRRVRDALRPPCVVAFLHIQPTITGHVYSQSEVESLAAVLAAAEVVALEDIAYHSIRCDLRDLPSMQRTNALTHTMIGLSKPMAIANFRIGLLYAEKSQSDRIRRALESTTGYISTMLQRALTAGLNSEEYDRYTTERSFGADGYEFRGRLVHQFLTGGQGELAGAARDLAMRQARRCPELAPFVDGFLATGLSSWLRPFNRPDAGFFQVVSCAPMLDSERFRGLGVRSSFDVFALLAYVFGMRTIPEEGMRPGTRAGTRLRIAFSVEPDVLAGLFLRVFAGLSVLAEG